MAVARVVCEFRAALPSALVYVYDNNSTDDTKAQAGAAGATVREEGYQGKGNVVRRMFADVEADVYVLVDGDATYDAASAGSLVSTLLDGHYDMVNGARVSSEGGTYRRGHRFGNHLLTEIVADIFGRQISDMLSGYRAFSRRFVKSFPALSEGFEIETELTVHALQLRMRIAEIETRYFARLEGSTSKLSTYRDGFRILMTVLKLIKRERPLPFFGAIALAVASISALLGVPLAIEFMETGLVPRFPTAILATGLMLSALLSLACGLILDTVTRGRLEVRRLSYLAIPGLRPSTRRSPTASANGVRRRRTRDRPGFASDEFRPRIGSSSNSAYPVDRSLSRLPYPEMHRYWATTRNEWCAGVILEMLRTATAQQRVARIAVASQCKGTVVEPNRLR